VWICKVRLQRRRYGCVFGKLYKFNSSAKPVFNQGLKNNYRKWVVEWATSSNDPEAAGVDKLNIFIGGLNSALVTKKGLEERFQLYGPIENTTLIKRDDSEDGGTRARSLLLDKLLSHNGVHAYRNSRAKCVRVHTLQESILVGFGDRTGGTRSRHSGRVIV
jgi:ABC-type phosphate transport system auxiliary subunit